MPDMDGLQATALIRAREAAGTRRVPIVAMTANVMKGDRERYLAAGMDDYVAKPIRPDELSAAVERWAPAADQEPRERAAGVGATASPPTPLDGAAILASFEGDLELARTVVDAVLNEYPRLMVEIREARRPW